MAATSLTAGDGVTVTTGYRPQSNDMIEQFHQQLKHGLK